MQIMVKGRNVPVTDQLRERVRRCFDTVGRQVSELATLEVELFEETSRAKPHVCVAEATLQLKGVTLRAKDASPDMARSIGLIADEMARQVKRHRDKRRARRAARAAAAAPPPMA